MIRRKIRKEDERLTFLQKNSRLKSLAKGMRKSMTKEECHLWFDFLREYPIRFMRQKIIDDYIVDFYCAKAKLAIEIDGSQHFEPDAMLNDKNRRTDIGKYGIKVLRFTNLDIWHEFEAVKNSIHQEVTDRLIDEGANAIDKGDELDG